MNNNVGNSVHFSKVHCLYCNDGWQGSVYLFQVKMYVTYCDLYQVLLVIGGQAPKAIRSVESYDFKEEKWHQLAEMPSRRCRCGKNFIH